MLNNIKLWWKFEGRFIHRNFIDGVKNLWRWFPAIWKDRDWDYDSIYGLLKFKLAKQSHYIKNKGYHVQAYSDAEKMMLCVRLIERLQSDFYRMEYMDYTKTTREFISTDSTKKWYTVDEKIEWDNLDEYFNMYPRQYKRLMSGEINFSNQHVAEKSRHLMAMEIGMENHERARKLLFKIMDQHIESWWN